MTSAKKWTDAKRPTLGSELLARKGTAREIGEAMRVSKSLAGYWMTGQRKPSDEHQAKLEEHFGVERAAWNEPPPPAPLSPWLRRLIREGITGIDHDADELERTVNVIAKTLTDRPALVADVLRALRKYA